MNTETPIPCRDCGRCSGCGAIVEVRGSGVEPQAHNCPHGSRCLEMDNAEDNDFELLCALCESARDEVTCGAGCTLEAQP